MCLGLHKGFSYLVPLYWRYKYEGRATNHLMFPLFTAISRKVVRQPIGGEFAFDRKMLARFTEVHRWSRSWREFGIDIGMTFTAGTSEDVIDQVVLPRKIDYVGQDARIQISAMFLQVGRSLFNGLLDFIESNETLEIKEVTTVPVVDIETVNHNNLKVELSDSAEVIGALVKFLNLFTSPAFQTNKDILGDFCYRIQDVYSDDVTSPAFQTNKDILGDFCYRIQDVYSEFEKHGIQGSILYDLRNEAKNDERQMENVVKRIQC
ncbi:uncharacterized protein LOC116294207 isoform X2 [Actinia tenebrosa]|nr:uncharacterized protein LOC116294207 isoform X2 [Actinia tenebrosa]